MGLNMEHPSGLTDDELGYVSAAFWSISDVTYKFKETPDIVWDRLLSFQQGWKACKDFYKIND